MMDSWNNIVFIGMPGAGKTTIGQALAKKLNKDFIDTDDLLKDITGMELKDYVLAKGKDGFMELQQSVILGLENHNCVIATGGSVACDSKAIEHLKKYGRVIYLKYSYHDIEKRISSSRRLARTNNQSLRDLYLERTPLYEKNADITVECSNKSVSNIVEEILSMIEAG
jgi:shikimate kinase